ncbi:hypothetical protein BDW71DRAFT_209039 [Aspergillus fruticulosus]
MTPALKGREMCLPARQQSWISLPPLASEPLAPHRSGQVEDDTKYFSTRGYIVMVYVDGRPLDSRWKALSDDRKRDSHAGSRRHIEVVIDQNINARAHRRRTLSRSNLHSLFCCSFKGTAGMQDWFNHKLEIAKAWNKAPKDTPDFQFTEFVLTHKGITPWNLILDPNGLV